MIMRTALMTQAETLQDETDKPSSQQESACFLPETSVNNSKATFTAVDMWNRNRQSRSASMFLRKWELN